MWLVSLQECILGPEVAQRREGKLQKWKMGMGHSFLEDMTTESFFRKITLYFFNNQFKLVLQKYKYKRMGNVSLPFTPVSLLPSSL